MINQAKHAIVSCLVHRLSNSSVVHVLSLLSGDIVDISDIFLCLLTSFYDIPLLLATVVEYYYIYYRQHLGCPSISY